MESNETEEELEDATEGEEEETNQIPDIEEFLADEEQQVEPTPTSPLPTSSPSPQRTPTKSHGKHGPRSGSSAGSEASHARALSGRDRDSRDSKSPSKDSSSAQKKPRGNLPTAPSFNGDRRADPRCFKKYVNKVDSYVALAEKIIDHGEIGLRLHAALEGEAADFLEEVPARTFGAPDGWKVLLRVLRDKYDETPMHKMGTAMKNFFNLQLAADKNLTMREVAEHLDKAARQCREAGPSRCGDDPCLLPAHQCQLREASQLPVAHWWQL